MRIATTAILLSLLCSACELEPSSPPTAKFLMDKPSAEINEYINFSNRSRLADSYTWNFGDAQSSGEKNPNHYYAKEGEYTIQLIASNAAGADDTVRTITITQPEIAWPAPGHYSGVTSETGHIEFGVSDKFIDTFSASFFATIAGTRYELNSSFEFGKIARTDSGFIASFQQNVLTGYWDHDSISGNWKHDYGTVQYSVVRTGN